MTHQPHTGHRAVIQNALDDWWINADFAEPFNTHTVTGLVDDYLTHAGYTITPDTTRTPMPTRASIALAIAVALLCLGGAIGAAIRTDWTWAAAGLIGAGAFAYEALGGITQRRHLRHTRPIPTDRIKNGQR